VRIAMHQILEMMGVRGVSSMRRRIADF
jgi:hypothetical protein